MSFSSLGLHASLLKAINAQGMTVATPIQKKAIPAVLQNKDVLGIAKTGSGKTASFILPILHCLQGLPASRYREPKVLVLVPTRELADQVQAVCQLFTSPFAERLASVAVYGGVSVNVQMQSIGKADLVIATPGRLLELVDKNAVKLSAITTLVIDEADKMLDLRFKDEVDRILALLPSQRQNLLFSATLSTDLSLIQEDLLRNPEVIHITDDVDRSDTLTTEGGEQNGAEHDELIRQLGYFVSEERKGPLLRYLIKHHDLQQVLVFASSTHKVDGIVDKLLKNKIDAAAIHAKKSQQFRRDMLREFKSGELRVLVATDLLSRGIDIEFLPCVINYELPRSPKDYVHRIGRTGRADSPGEAISLITPAERQHFRVIQKKMGKRVAMLQSEDINLHGY